MGTLSFFAWSLARAVMHCIAAALASVASLCFTGAASSLQSAKILRVRKWCFADCEAWSATPRIDQKHDCQSPHGRVR
jgi:hypothetical protein